VRGGVEARKAQRRTQGKEGKGRNKAGMKGGHRQGAQADRMRGRRSGKKGGAGTRKEKAGEPRKAGVRA